MRLPKRFGRVPGIVVGLAAAGAAFGIATAVQAAIPDSNGTIHACYQFANAVTPKGTLRVVDSAKGESCRFYEHPLTWNANGVGGVYAISGQVDDTIFGGAPFPADQPAWQFEGPTATVTITATQSILANISASLGFSEGQGAQPGAKPQIEPQYNEFGFGVCFQGTGNEGEEYPVVNMNQFTGGNDANFAAASYFYGEADYTGIGTAAPGAGTYNVGYCVQNYGDTDLNDNSWANGYVEVVDGLPDTSGVSQAPRPGQD
jgi:hypothetical protein